MNSDKDLKSYLLVSPKKIAILVKEELNLEEIYKKEIEIYQNKYEKEKKKS